ncbi:MAG: hypothetical protein ACI4D9_08995 [Lachnospiraceae bacterium]
MNNENFHPVLKVPPLAHALHKWDEEQKILKYEYNGTDIISMQIEKSEDTGFRHGSDGTMQSIAYIQQIYIMVEKPMWVTVRFCLSDNTICMRAHRAGSEQGIAAQNGNILIHGINGLYDAKQDLLIEVNGCEWNWASEQFEEVDGQRIAYMNILLSEKPVFINLRMYYYKNHLGYKYYEPWKHQINKKAVAGWCSWEAFRRDIDEEKINGIAQFMEEHLKDYGLEYIQVDDGYQKMPLPYRAEGDMKEGWMTCEEKKFPRGHQGIVEDIRKHGFVPAIWTNANITNEEYPENHPKDVIFHEGKAIKGEWIDYLYSCVPENLEKQVTPVFEGFRDAGYKYVKIDAIRHLLLDGLHEAVRLGIMSNEEAEQKFRAYMEAGKKGMSEDMYYLASWGEMHEVVGVADACRISMDANPTWAGIRMQLFEMARWFHTQRILFLNDPDHVCVRTKPEWAKSVLSLISLAGGLCMLSDTQDAYTEEKLEIIQKTLPPLTTSTAETGPLNLDFPAYTWTKLHGFAVQSHETPVEMEDVNLKDAYDMAGIYPTMEDDHPFSTLWSFHLNHAEESWCVAGRFATIPLKESELLLEQINLDPKQSYHVFDFWKQEYLGVVTGNVAVRALGLGECQILAFRKVKDIPQFIASSRHVSMDAVSIQKINWEQNQLSVLLEGVAGTSENYYFAVPKDYTLQSTEVEGGECKVVCDDGIICATVAFQEEIATLTLSLS